MASRSSVVMDEPNSNLDGEGEAALKTAIEAVKERGGIAVVVAHRPSALVAVDFVCVIQNGKLIGVRAEERDPRPPRRGRARTAAPTQLKMPPGAQHPASLQCQARTGVGMIEVKSLRPADGGVPTARRDLPQAGGCALRHAGPAAIVLALTAIAIYLKSLFPSLAKSDLGPPTEKQEEDGAEGPPPGSRGERRMKPVRFPKEDEYAIGSGGGPERRWHRRFHGHRFTRRSTIELLPLPSSADAPSTRGFRAPRPSNDNRTNVAFDNTAVGLSGIGAVSSRGFEALSYPRSRQCINAARRPGRRTDGNNENEDDGGGGDPTNPSPTPSAIARPSSWGPVALADTGICRTILITVAALLFRRRSTRMGTRCPSSISRSSSGTLTKRRGRLGVQAGSRLLRPCLVQL